MPDVTVFIVEDDEATRANLVRKVERASGQQVVGSAATLADARALLAQNQPDILLVDLQLPDGDGTSLIAEQTAMRPEMPILVISVFGDEEPVVGAIAAGAQGYLLKDDDGKEI